MAHRICVFTVCLFIAVICILSEQRFLIGAGDGDVGNSVSSFAAQNTMGSTAADDSLAGTLGVEFVKGSTSAVIISRNGKKYLVNLVTHSIREVDPPAGSSMATQDGDPPHSALAGEQANGVALFAHNCSSCHGSDGKGLASLKTPDFTKPAVQASLTDAQMTEIIENGMPGTMMPAWRNKLSAEEIGAVQHFVRSLATGSRPGGQLAQQAAKPRRKIYTPGDDVLFTLPTGRPVDKHGLYVNFAHRFPYVATFSDPASGGALGGLDDFAIPSFGFRYGLTERLSVSVYRESSIIGRPIQFLGVYNFMEEGRGSPLNIAAGVAMEGQNNFSTNFAESLEGIVSRSISSRAQLYLVPTLTFNNRPLRQVTTYFSSGFTPLPGHNTFSLGVGGALDIRPTVAFVAEVIPTLANGRPMGILRPSFSFGIQKKIWRHAFTFGWTTAPGTTVAERASTRASFLGQPNADTPDGLFIGFDLTRQLF
jgi:mono/diheme cytochrome c family protein